MHALKSKEVDTRIESEIATLRTSIQSAKFNVLQTLTGVATGAVRPQMWSRGKKKPRADVEALLAAHMAVDRAR